MVAISILMLAILGPLSIVSKGIQNAAFARDQVTAYYLAQEGIDYIRFLRDDYAINGKGWSQFINDVSSCTNISLSNVGCEFSADNVMTSSTRYNPVLPAGCAAASNCVLYTDPTGKYVASSNGNTLTPFTRIITMTQINLNEYQVKVVMSWQTNNITKTFSLGENIFNIY